MTNSIKFNFTLKNLVLLPIYSLAYAVVYVLKFVWEMFFAIPAVPKRFYGFLRFILSVGIILNEVGTGLITDFGGHLISNENIAISAIGLVCILFILYVFFVNILLGIMMMFGFNISFSWNYQLKEGEYLVENPRHSNINSAMDYIDTKMAFKGDIDKVEYMKEIFGGKK